MARDGDSAPGFRLRLAEATGYAPADNTRLYLEPARDADLLEVLTIVREDGSELAIHAMRMRPKYLPLLEGD
ncbi:MAG: hypothetical protein WB507_07805 [Solirubrobacterales bacterium]